MKPSSVLKSKPILTWSERITPGVPNRAVNYSLMEENKELRLRIAELEGRLTNGSGQIVAKAETGPEAVKILRAAGILDKNNKLSEEYR